MVEDIYDPLEEYSNVYREKFKKVCEDTFAELAREANIDIEANRQTCQKVYDNEAFLAKIKSKITWWTVLCVLLWIGVIVGALSIYGNKTEWGNRTNACRRCGFCIIFVLSYFKSTP